MYRQKVVNSPVVLLWTAHLFFGRIWDGFTVRFLPRHYSSHWVEPPRSTHGRLNSRFTFQVSHWIIDQGVGISIFILHAYEEAQSALFFGMFWKSKTFAVSCGGDSGLRNPETHNTPISNNSPIFVPQRAVDFTSVLLKKCFNKVQQPKLILKIKILQSLAALLITKVKPSPSSN